VRSWRSWSFGTYPSTFCLVTAMLSCRIRAHMQVRSRNRHGTVMEPSRNRRGWSWNCLGHGLFLGIIVCIAYQDLQCTLSGSLQLATCIKSLSEVTTLLSHRKCEVMEWSWTTSVYNHTRGTHSPHQLTTVTWERIQILPRVTGERDGEQSK
jgi:hypothetical protein